MPSSACQKCALDRKSTRLNSSHTIISYAVFCLKKESRSEEHTSELQSHDNLVCRLLLEKKQKDAPTEALRLPPPACAVGSAAPVHQGAVVGAGMGRLREHGISVVLIAHRMFFFIEGAPPKVYLLPLHKALPI